MCERKVYVWVYVWTESLRLCICVNGELTSGYMCERKEKRSGICVNGNLTADYMCELSQVSVSMNKKTSHEFYNNPVDRNQARYDES